MTTQTLNDVVLELIEKVSEVLRNTRNHESWADVDVLEDGTKVVERVRTLSREDAELALQKLISVKHLLPKLQKETVIKIERVPDSYPQPMKPFEPLYPYPEIWS